MALRNSGDRNTFFLRKRAESEHQGRYRESQPVWRATHRQVTFRERLNANAGKGGRHCLRERLAFPNHSTRSFPRSVVSSLQPGLDGGTENQYQTEPDQSRLRRATFEARDHLPKEPYPNTCGETCQQRYLAARRPG